MITLQVNMEKHRQAEVIWVWVKREVFRDVSGLIQGKLIFEVFFLNDIDVLSHMIHYLLDLALGIYLDDSSGVLLLMWRFIANKVLHSLAHVC